MRLIKDYGPVYHGKVYDEFGHNMGKKILTRLKSRGVISPIRDEETGYRRYDLNEIGFEILKESDSRSETSRKAIGETQEN